MGFTKVVVAIDFSDESIAALRRAAALVTESAGELHIVHVIPSLVYRGVAYVAPLSPDGRATERAAAERALSEALEAAGGDLTSASVELLEGEPRSEILSHAEEIGADLIVVSSHGQGHGRLRKLLLGSVAGHIANAASCSVLIVRA